jgi:hypothetical protein
MIGAADGGDAEWPADGCLGEAPEEAASGTEWWEGATKEADAIVVAVLEPKG